MYPMLRDALESLSRSILQFLQFNTLRSRFACFTRANKQSDSLNIQQCIQVLTHKHFVTKVTTTINSNPNPNPTQSRSSGFILLFFYVVSHSRPIIKALVGPNIIHSYSDGSRNEKIGIGMKYIGAEV